MKKIFLAILLTVFLTIPTHTSAHMIGQQPYFKVNGTFTDYYPVPSTSLPDFKLPQDIVKMPVLINQQLNFEIVTNALPVPPQVVEMTTFSWDYGDGTKAQGLKNSHAYSKPGTYFLEIYADAGGGFGAQLLQSTAINVLPDKNYKLPQAKILVNGRQSNDPLLDILDVNFGDYIDFDGSKSDPGSSQITGYIWDLGDQNSKTDVTLRYKYSENPYTVFPVLRIKTKDGFISDNFIQIKDEKTFTESSIKPLASPSTLSKNSGSDWLVSIAAIGSLALAVGLIFLVSKFVSKKRNF